MSARLRNLHRALIERGAAGSTPASNRMPAAIVTAIDAKKAAAVAAGTNLAPEWRALDRRREVERLSVAGKRVAEIAAALGISARHVVTIRAELGVGRRR